MMGKSRELFIEACRTPSKEVVHDLFVRRPELFVVLFFCVHLYFECVQFEQLRAFFLIVVPCVCGARAV
jgi:hypothetical protein